MKSGEHVDGLLEALLDATVDAVIIMDEEGTIHRFNPAAQRMFGWSEAEITGHSVEQLMPNPHASRHRRYVGNYLATGKAAIIGKGREERGVRRNGEVFPMRLAVGHFRHHAGNYFVGIISDISLQRATEERLKALETQLIHADRLVTLGEMTAGIAHEVNQPLTAIAAYADAGAHLLKRSETPPLVEMQGICERIAEQSRRAAAVIERLRGLVRNQPSHKGEHDLIKLINNVLQLFDHDRKNTGISLEFKHPDTPLEVFVDEIQVQQVIVNLVKNSLDALQEAAIPAGQVRIEICPTQEFVEIRVSDNGPGVSEDALPVLFEAFHTTKARGVGLGLSICRSIANAHGGQLTHQPREGGGATFVLRLPRKSIG